MIRTDILLGRHRPDKKLKIPDLADELGVSPGAVREALSRLVPEELVVARDQRGFVVAPLSPEDLIELTDLRCEIESIALRLSVKNGDVDWEAGILAAEYKLRSEPVPATGEDPRLKWAQNHAQFHSALVSACGNRRLFSLHGQLYEQSERYRGLLFDLESDRDVNEEHHEMVKFALARDADALVQATVDHLRRTTALIIESFVRREQEKCAK
ncbi:MULTISPECIES: FCD domain-containing protein [Sphingobium]|uniref:FCD domain-containing protein n=1 Tax=Sphingobium TaxID=165695 RepID=UPI00159C54CC